MSFVIRLAEPRDDHAVGELLVDAFVTSYAEKMPEVVVNDERKRDLRAVAEKRAVATVFVAELDGKIVGTVAIFKPGSKGSEAWTANTADLRHLAVDPHRKITGLATALMDRAEAECWSWGVDAISLHVRRGAEGVARFYQKRGYARRVDGDLDYLPSVFLEAYILSS